VVTPVSFSQGDHQSDTSSDHEHHEADYWSQEEHSNAAHSQKYTQPSHRFFHHVFLLLGVPFDTLGWYTSLSLPHCFTPVYKSSLLER
jgi:hypothetical protein